MSIGLGIFLSSLLFALILLYLITRDRWNWRRIARRLGVGALIFGCLTGLVAGGIYVWNGFAPVVKQTEYAGLRLGTTMEEAKYVKGLPTHVYDEFGREGIPKGLRRMIPIKELEKEKKIEDYNDWIYQDEVHRIEQASEGARYCLWSQAGPGCRGA